MNSGNFMTTRLLSFFLLLLFTSFAQAGQVTGPNGEYKESHTDLSVKVRGGAVSVERSWLNGRWYVNPAWADLKFTYDALDGSVKTIDRAGSVFEGSGEVFVFDDRFFVRKTTREVNGETVSGWRWSNTAGDWVDYDADGRIAAYGDRHDVSVRFVRNGAGQISEVRDDRDALVLTFTYTNGQVTTITDRANRAVNYTWSGTNLTSVEDVLGHDWTYTYDGNGQITGGAAPVGDDGVVRNWSLTYVASYKVTGAAVPVGVSFSGVAGRDFRISRVATFKNEAGHTFNYEYDYDRGKRQWSFIRKYPSGRREASVYDLDGRIVRQEEGSVVTYDRTKDGDRVEYSKDERGQITRRELDSTRNVTKISSPDGTSESWVYHPRFAFPTEHVDARGTKTTYRYNDQGDLVEKIEAVDAPEQRTTTYAWNALGQMTSMTIKGAAEAEDATTTYSYDDHGNVATITDAEQITTRYTHHVTGQVETTTDGRNKVWTNSYNDAGWLISRQDPIHPATTFGYDKVGNRITTTDAANQRTTFTYDPLNRLVKTTDAKQGESTTEYNPDGLITRRVDPSGQATTMQYDARGRLWKVIDGANNVTETVYGTAENALNGLVAAMQYPTYREEYKYDPRGRRTQTIRILSPDRRETTSTGYDANGQTISSTDALGRSTLYAYDKLNRLTQTTDALGGQTKYTYDARDNLLSLTDANQNTHRFTYDRRNRVLTEARPMGQTHRYRYDDNGNLVEKIDARNQTTKTTYDDANQRTQVDYFQANSEVAHKTVTFTYNERGLLTGYDDRTTSASYGYDELGRKTTETVDYGPFNLGHSYTYKANGQKASYTAPDGTTISYDYTDHGQLQTITIPDEGTISYGNFQWSRPQTVTYPGNIVRTQTFDALMRTQTITVKNAQNATLMAYGYAYDAVGNITKKATEHGDYHYGYDALDRLTRADYPNGQDNDQINQSFEPNTFPFKDDQFSYDLLGNRLTDQAQTTTAPWQYNANNELLNSSLNLYAYNENGSTIEKKAPNDQVEQRYVYNSEERLAEVKDATDQTIASYYYDPFGRRLWKTVAPNQPGNDSASPKTTYLYYTDEGYAAEYTHTGNHPNSEATITPVLSQLYLFAPQGLWSTEPLAIKQSGEQGGWRYPETDHLGTPHGLISKAGTETTDLRANAFGQTEVMGEPLPLRFAGQTEDDETGGYYNFHRDYEPNLGRYRESDPIGLKGGKNLFLFARANGVVNFDPLGLLTAYKKCDADQTQKIKDAEKKIMDLLKDCKEDCDAGGNSCVPCKDVKKLRERLQSMSIQCSDGGGCGQENPVGGWFGIGAQITVYPATFDPKQCGCLEASIFHEVLHSVSGRHIKPYNDKAPSCSDPTAGGDPIYGTERKCFPCACGG
jgi:RHS repeat-associated protein